MTSSIDHYSRAVIKSSFEKQILEALKHEHTCYSYPTIRSSQHIRVMYEEINTDSSPENMD
jgi:hypothetical protein